MTIETRGVCNDSEVWSDRYFLLRDMMVELVLPALILTCPSSIVDYATNGC